MKIAIDIREASGEKAGKGWYTLNIVKSLLNLDQKNEYILYSKNFVPSFPENKTKIIKGKGLAWHLNVLRALKKEQVDLFFAPSSYIIPALLPKNIKSILTVHDLIAFLFPQKHNKKALFLEKLFLKKALKKADHILSVSQNTKDDLMKKFRTPSEKISLTPCAASQNFQTMDKKKLQKFSKETNLPPKFFLAVGTIIPRKNYLVLLKAFLKINELHPGYHLIIVGSKGWGSGEVDGFIKENYLSKKVHLLGYLSNKSLVNLYNLAEALVFPSLYEGFGIPPLEAMQCGCPVLASASSSIPEVVGTAALLFDPKDPNELISALKKIIQNPALRQELIQKGFQQSRKFSWETSAQKLLQVLKNT